MFIEHGKNDNTMGANAAAFVINPLPEPECMEYRGRVFKHDEIDNLIHRAAVGLQKLGVGPGMTVGLMLPNCPYTVICTFAAIKAGATVEHYDTESGTLDIARRVHATETEIMITSDAIDIYKKINRILIDTPVKLAVICPMKDLLPKTQRMFYPLLHRHDIADIPMDQWHVMFDELIDNNGCFTPIPPC